MAARDKERVDVLLVELGLVESRARAQARILAGEVIVDCAGWPVVRGGTLGGADLGTGPLPPGPFTNTVSVHAAGGHDG